jgi:hypothetical protein
VSSVLYNAACLGDKDKRISKNKKSKRKIKKPYYDNECENKYRILKAKSRQLCNEPWNKTLCLKVLQNKKELSKLVRKKYRQFRHTMLNKLVDSNANNPGEFWKALNAIKQRDSKDPSSNIIQREWFDYLKKLMNMNYTNNFNINNIPKELQSCELLNKEILAEEVVLALRSLKNKKSCGPDSISSEMLKMCCSFNIDLFVKLFNVILKSGVYPYIWRENFIIPIFKGGCVSDPSNYRGIALSRCMGKFPQKFCTSD